MNTLSLFTIEVLLCLGISIAVIVLLKPLLRDVLIETCGTTKRADFWVMFTQLMLVISPLLIVIFLHPQKPPLPSISQRPCRIPCSEVCSVCSWHWP